MSGYPWSVLGLEAPASERDIRSAYARRLKLVRPDSDPAGFQKLVEARGYAIDMARSRAANPAAYEDEDDDEDLEGEGLEGENESPVAPQDLVLDETGPPIGRSADSPKPVAIDVTSGEPALRMDESQPPFIAPQVSIELHDPMPQPMVAPATGEPETMAPPSTGMATHAAPPEPILLEPDDVLARLRNLFSTMGPAASPGEADRVLADLERLPRSIRQMIEPEILQAMARSLPVPVKDKFPRLSAILRWMDLIADPIAEQSAKAETRRRLFVALDDNYGWTTSDRRVHRCLPPGQAVQLMTHLQASHKELRIAREGLPARWDGDGLPILDPVDLQAFFGSELPHYGVAYHEAKRARIWAPNWRPWLLLLAPVWMLPLRQYRLIGIWLGTMFVSGLGLTFIETNVMPLLLGRFPQTGAALTAFVNVLPFLPMIALHIHVARNNGQLEVERLARLAAKADRKGLFDPQRRASFFRRRVPDFRFPDGKKKSGGFWDNWWWIIVGITVIRLIGMMFK